VPGVKPIERRLNKFLREPASVRNALAVIVVSTTTVVLLAGVLMRVVDSSEYPNVGRGLWWAIQTVTTVGYGDVTPAHTAGRLVGVVVMLWGIALVTILVATITSTFVSRATEQRLKADEELAESDQTDEQRLMARLDDLVDRLDRIEQSVARLTQ